jgi:hypothetical protein
MDNYTQIPLLRKGEDGVYTLAYPVGEDAPFPLVDIVRDMGAYYSNSFYTLHPGNMRLTGCSIR